MIVLVDAQGRPAQGASAFSAHTWQEIPEVLRRIYPVGDEPPQKGQSDLYHWRGDEEPEDEERVALRQVLARLRQRLAEDPNLPAHELATAIERYLGATP